MRHSIGSVSVTVKGYSDGSSSDEFSSGNGYIKI